MKKINLYLLSVVNILALVSCNEGEISASKDASSNQISESSSSSEITNSSEEISASDASSEAFSYEESYYSYTPYDDSDGNQDFATFCDEIFPELMGDDVFGWNIYTIKRDNFGYVKGEEEPSFYSYEPVDVNEAYIEDKAIYDELLTFASADLSESQKITYDVLEEYLRYIVDYYNPENGYDPNMSFNFIDQWGGSCSTLCDYIEAYSFWDEDAIKDLISVLKSLDTVIPTYLDYAQDRIDAGYPLSDYTIDAQIEYLDGILDFEGDFYLIDVLNNKMDEVYFLPENEKEAYKAELKAGINDHLLKSFESFADNLENYKGQCDYSSYLASYGEKGKEYYAYLLRERLGYYNLDLDDYETQLKTALDYYADLMNDQLDLYSKFSTNLSNQFIKYYNGTSIITIKEPLEMIDYLKEFSSTIISPLESEPEIGIKYMPTASGEASNAVAYYMKSALDNSSKEMITLNSSKLGSDYNKTLSTLSHEGYPGHLYAWCNVKENDNISDIVKILSNTSHAEGWATYVQHKLWNYLKKNNTCSSANKTAAKVFCAFMDYQDYTSYILYSYLDFEIHYRGYDEFDVKNVLGNYGFNEDANKEIFYTLVECPTEYQSYGFGKLHFTELHDNASKALGAQYDEAKFNDLIFSHGWIGYDLLDALVDDYIKSFDN